MVRLGLALKQQVNRFGISFLASYVQRRGPGLVCAGHTHVKVMLELVCEQQHTSRHHLVNPLGFCGLSLSLSLSLSRSLSHGHYGRDCFTFLHISVLAFLLIKSSVRSASPKEQL